MCNMTVICTRKFCNITIIPSSIHNFPNFFSGISDNILWPYFVPSRFDLSVAKRTRESSSKQDLILQF